MDELQGHMTPERETLLWSQVMRDRFESLANGCRVEFVSGGVLSRSQPELRSALLRRGLTENHGGYRRRFCAQNRRAE